MGRGLNFRSMATKEDLRSDVSRLPPEERAELERRAREVLGGSVKTVSWEQVEERIRARLGPRR
ncbi:addiction module protein [Archangium primigenium]|nr:addiction module protein [Archangium primigenium]